MAESAKLRIPYIAAAQAQKHVTHNEAMTLLDTLVQLSVLDKDLTAPPGSPDEGDCYIVAGAGGTATGAWAGWEKRVARFIDGEWRSYLPGEGDGAGWLAWVLDEDAMYRFDGTDWELAGIEGPPGPALAPDAVVNVIAGRDDYDDEAAAFAVLVVSDASNDNKPTLYYKLSAASADWSDPVPWPEGGSPPIAHAPAGRVTLESGVPVSTSDQLAKTAIYWTPIDGGYAWFWDGTIWTPKQLAELSLPLDSNSGHTGYHQSGKNFDLFLDWNSGTPRLVSGPAWSNDTTRGYSLTRVNGILMNAATMTVRFGTGSGDTASIAAERLIYVGTFRASANGQTQILFGSAAAGGGEAWFGLWNMYHRVRSGGQIHDTTNSWSLSSSSYVAANASNTNRVSFVRGRNEDAVDATYNQIGTNAAGGFVYISIGLDSTSAAAGIGTHQLASNTVGLSVSYRGLPGLGFHYLQEITKISAGTGTLFGDNNTTDRWNNMTYELSY